MTAGDEVNIRGKSRLSAERGGTSLGKAMPSIIGSNSLMITGGGIESPAKLSLKEPIVGKLNLKKWVDNDYDIVS